MVLSLRRVRNEMVREAAGVPCHEINRMERDNQKKMRVDSEFELRNLERNGNVTILEFLFQMTLHISNALETLLFFVLSLTFVNERTKNKRERERERMAIPKEVVSSWFGNASK